MPFITFIYKIKNHSKTYYGKLCSHYLSEHLDGLEKEVKTILLNGINIYRNKNNQPNLKKNNLSIGILSISDKYYFKPEFIKKEMKCFDFYYIHKDCLLNSTVYVNGQIYN